jgi:hybrid cluster-associated redox disulfide protein
LLKGTGMIDKDMIIGDIVRRYPQTLAVFEKYKLTCFECQIADYEALEHGADVHHVNVANILKELNEAAKDSK